MRYRYGHVFTFLRIRGRIRTTIYGEPHDLGDTWDGIRMECTCGVSHCVHLAASLLFWEKSHGPWVVWEDEYKYKQRKEKEEILEQRKQRKADAERAGLEPVSAVRAFQDRRMSVFLRRRPAEPRDGLQAAQGCRIACTRRRPELPASEGGEGAGQSHIDRNAGTIRMIRTTPNIRIIGSSIFTLARSPSFRTAILC